LARTGIHGADVPVGTRASAHPIVVADGRVAPLFQAEGQTEKESRQEGAAEGEEKAGEKEGPQGEQEETASLKSNSF
jgi:hypothetical protein